MCTRVPQHKYRDERATVGVGSLSSVWALAMRQAWWEIPLLAEPSPWLDLIIVLFEVESQIARAGFKLIV